MDGPVFLKHVLSRFPYTTDLLLIHRNITQTVLASFQLVSTNANVCIFIFPTRAVHVGSVD